MTKNMGNRPSNSEKTEDLFEKFYIHNERLDPIIVVHTEITHYTPKERNSEPPNVRIFTTEPKKFRSLMLNTKKSNRITIYLKTIVENNILVRISNANGIGMFRILSEI